MSWSAARRAGEDNRWLIGTLVAVGIAVSVALIVVSALLNFRIGYRTADTEIDGWIYGVGAASADGLKAMAPFAAAWGWRKRDWLAVAAAAVVFCVMSGYSLSSAVGFAAQHRVFKQAEQSGAFEKRRDLRKENERIQAVLSALGPQRGEGEVEAAMRAVLAGPAGERGRTVEQWSGGCTLNRKETRKACAEVAGLAEELERSREQARLSEAAKNLRERLDAVKGGSGSGDPQLDALEELVALAHVGATRRQIEVTLSVLVALFIELGSGLGLYVVTTPWRNRKPERARRVNAARAGETEADPGPLRSKGSAMKTGPVEDFMLQRLVPSDGGELSKGDAYYAYVAWCRDKRLVPLARERFGKTFDELAGLAGLAFSGRDGNGVYRDVALAAK